MIVMTEIDVFMALCKALGKHGVYISFATSDNFCDEELLKAAPYLNFDDHGQAILEGHAVILCDSEEEMCDIYEQTVGDDGPTARNPYNGPTAVYALTCGPDGEPRSENT